MHKIERKGIFADTVDYPVTSAIRVLRSAGVSFSAHRFDYVEKGGTAHSSQVLGVDEHLVIKTLIFEDEHKQPLCVLMHGDKEVSTKALARIMGVKMIKPCQPEVAEKHSGYQVGGTSPFGLRKPLPIYMQATIASLPTLFINGGGRGFLVQLLPSDLIRVLNPQAVEIAQ